MNNSSNIFVQYLKYLWKRKWLILLVTVLFAALGYLYEQSRSTETYHGSALIFLGNAENDKASKPETVKGDFKKLLPKELKDKLDVEIPDSGYQILISLDGPNSDVVEKNLNDFTRNYFEDLMEDFVNQKQDLLDQQDILKENIKSIEEKVEEYKKAKNQVANSQIDNLEFQRDLLKSEELISKFELKYQKVKKAITKLKEPELADDVSVVPISNKPFLNPLTAAALGFQLMIVFLVLYKYITDVLKAEREREAKS